MINNLLKKSISFFVVLTVCFLLLPSMCFDSFAADGVGLRLEKLKKDFPSGCYYNHKVKTEGDKQMNLLIDRDESYSRSISKYPCVHHGDEAEIGAYDCNYFDGGYQCHGFAAMLFYEIFGVRQSTLEKREEAPFNVKPGDLVRLKKGTHSAIVVSVSDKKFTVAECNVTQDGSSESCKISWGRSYSLSDITYYVRADNYAKISADTNWKNIEDKENQGKSFYAAICNSDKSKALTVDSKNNVVFKSYSGSAAQVWKFERQKNGSYKITSCKNGLLLSVKGNSSSKANVEALKADGKKGQLWAFYPSGNKLYLSADCTSRVLTVESNGNICSNKKSSSSTRLFTLKKTAPPEQSKIKSKGANGYASLSWSKGDNTSYYSLEVFKASGKLYKKYEKLTKTSLKLSLPAGVYSARITSNNSFSKTVGNTTYFTVGKKGVLGKTAKVSGSSTTSSIKLSWTSVPDADGYALLYKKSGKWKTVARVTKTSYTLKKLSAGEKYSLAIRAYKVEKGKRVLSKQYVTFTMATKPKAPKKITATQTGNSVKLSWAAINKASGYRVYQKTSSGWKTCATTGSTTKTIKGLTAGKSYTYGVRAYIKTSLGVVWGEIKSITTATKPKAPKVTLSDVKNRSAKIRWDKVSGADGYQVFYKFDDSKSYTHLANYKATDGGVELTKLTKGVYYTFAVRAYKKVGNSYIFGPYSTVRFESR